MNHVMDLTLKSPLFTEWSPQLVHLHLPGVKPGTPLKLRINGKSAAFQYTGETSGKGAEIVLLLGFGKNEVKRLEFSPSGKCSTDMTHLPMPFIPSEVGRANTACIGMSRTRLRLATPTPSENGLVVTGPFAGFSGWPMKSRVSCEQPFEGVSLTRTGKGPIFEEYLLEYRFAQYRRYAIRFRFFRHEPIVEVAERFSLGMNAKLTWTLNPRKLWDKILSRDSFEGESQPTVEDTDQERPKDVLCRLQMPVLSEYFIPNNRGWFAFYDSRNEERGMCGILGLYGARWQEPVANMPALLARGGAVEWHASLASGARYWLLYSGPVRKQYTAEERLVFHRLHAEFNALRLDEHIDLTGGNVYDQSNWKSPGIFEDGDFHAAARRRLEALPPLRKAVGEPGAWEKTQRFAMHTAIVRALLDPTPERRRELYDSLVARFELWVRQFQGWRRGDNDYQKNVIGFTRWLRGMLIAYEMLRRDGALSNEEIGRLNAYFVFAARRIMDEGRWPHSRTTLHPDHPESSRDFYEYGGEHKPDRLFWTNCLPNFQSDPLCALAHLSALFPDHPDAPAWRRKALDDLDGQLDAYCGKSGAWEESINYALYTFSYFVITFRALKQKLGIDYFNDERVRRYAAWLVRFFGPRDKRFGAWTWPAIGNAVVPQNQADYLLCYAAELPEADPLREQCLAVYQLCEPDCRPGEHFPTMVAAMAPIPGRPYTLEPVDSEHMDELGVAMRHASRTPSESYLFQKIGFWKDHYENDESAFNWYAKGTPFCMEYGTYTGDAAAGGAHNLVEIPDMDGLRRGYLADHLFTPALDYTRCEMPVTLKLLWGRVRSFEEVDDKDGKIDRTKTPYFYIGDDNPVGPKTWKVRMLFFVKPDYLALFDRVYGDVPHRYNLHFTGGSLRREGQIIRGDGRFELDLECLVQRPSQFEMETGELVPNLNRPGRDPEEMLKHAQRYFRVHNHTDGIYRTLLFARERGRNVQLRPFGQHGMQVVTSEYTDYIFLHNEPIRDGDGGVLFAGRAGWIRRDAHGRVQAILADGDELRAFGVVLKGRGPWTYNLDGTGAIDIKSDPPRPVSTV